MVSKRSQFDDFVRGSDTSIHALKMLFYSGFTLFVIALSICLLVGFVFAAITTTSNERELSRKYTYHYVVNVMTKRNLGRVSVQINDKAFNLSRYEFLSADWVQKPVISVYRQLGFGLVFGAIIGAIYLTYMLRIFRAKGEKLRQDELIRGAEVVPPETLRSYIKEMDDDSKDLSIGDIPILRNSETGHFLISGAPGSGKTVAIMQLLDAIKKRGDAVVVYDKKGTFVEKYYCDGDTILSAVDERSPAWTPWCEISHPADNERLAATLIPDEKEGEKIWAQAARTVLVAALSKLRKAKDLTIPTLLKACLFTDIKILSNMLKGTEAGLIINEENPKTALSVTMNIAAHISSLKYLRSSIKKGTFSIIDWMKNVDSGKGNSWLFITSNDRFHEALKPLITTWMDSAASALLSRKTDLKRRVWFVLDELPSLGKMDSVKTLLAEGREYGACGVLGAQSIAQIRDTFGKDGAEIISGLCNTKVIFRATDPDTAEWNSRLLGEEDVEEARENMTYGVAESRDSLSLNEDRKLRKIVLPTELIQLRKLCAYVRLPGAYPVAKTDLIIKERAAIAEPFLQIDIEETTWHFFENLQEEAEHKFDQGDLNFEPTETDSNEIQKDEDCSDDILFGR